jgi:hypothetical protein
MVTLLDPLPRRVRLRLWCQHQIDGAGYWLVCHRQFKAAEMLWRVTGGWD